MTKHKESCDCLFCNSKCPECGSINIMVKYQPTFEYENSTKNLISINRSDDFLEVHCFDCGEDFTLDGTGNESLEPLRQALEKVLDLPYDVHLPIDDAGVIDATFGKILTE